jgi:NAD(P)H dehydrogenase (quinone)
MSDTSVCIVYFSGFRGHTRRLAESVAEGAAGVTGVSSRLIPVTEVDDHWDALHAADAIVFGSPTYVGSVAARFKEFIERLAGDIWLQRAWLNKLAGGFTVSAGRSGDKFSTLSQLAVAAAQMGMLWVPLPMTGGHYSSAGSEAELNRIAGYLGVMAQANIDEGPDRAPPPSDLETARVYGAHIAALARQFRAGRQALGITAPPFSGRPRAIAEMLPPP